MSFATDSDYDDDDLGHGYIRRPISVAELCEREGYQPATRSRATKRALSGVAAGAVLALGAVVGSLLLNHGGPATAGDTLASGGIGQSGGDIVLAETSPQTSTVAPGGTHSTSPTTSTSGTATKSTTVVTTDGKRTWTGSAQHNTSVGNQGPGNHSPVSSATTKSGTASITTGTTTTTTAPTTSTTTTTAPTTGTTAPTTGSTSTTTPPATTTPSSPTTGTTTTTPPSTTTGSSGDNGGLLGTVTGVLGNVTQPVFNWFG